MPGCFTGYLRNFLIVFLVAFFIFISTCPGVAQEIENPEQLKTDQSKQQELVYPEWDGVYLLTNDGKFVELKPLKKFFGIVPQEVQKKLAVTAGLFQRFNQNEFNLYSLDNIQGLFVRGKDYIECISLYRAHRYKYLDEYFSYDDKRPYVPAKKRSVGPDGILIKFDDFETSFGLIENNDYLLIICERQISKKASDLKIWIVGASRGSLPSPR